MRTVSDSILLAPHTHTLGFHTGEKTLKNFFKGGTGIKGWDGGEDWKEDFKVL